MGYIVYLTKHQLSLASEEDDSDVLLQRSNPLHRYPLSESHQHNEEDEMSTMVGDTFSPPLSATTAIPDIYPYENKDIQLDL